MAVLVRSGRRDLPVLQRALLAAGILVEVARDDIPLARRRRCVRCSRFCGWQVTSMGV